MAGKGWELLERLDMTRNDYKMLQWLDMAENIWKGPEWLEICGNGWNDRNWLEMKYGWNGWKWLERLNMAGHGWNGSPSLPRVPLSLSAGAVLEFAVWAYQGLLLPAVLGRSAAVLLH